MAFQLNGNAWAFENLQWSELMMIKANAYYFQLVFAKVKLGCHLMNQSGYNIMFMHAAVSFHFLEGLANHELAEMSFFAIPKISDRKMYRHAQLALTCQRIWNHWTCEKNNWTWVWIDPGIIKITHKFQTKGGDIWPHFLFKESFLIWLI